jgi:hypothetical protein
MRYPQFTCVNPRGILMLEWIGVVGGIVISWPMVGLVALWLFRAPLLNLARQFGSDDISRLNVGGVFEIERMKTEVKKTRTQIDRLYALSMSEEAFFNLKKLATGSYGPFWLDPDLKVGLAAELSYSRLYQIRSHAQLH